MRIWVTGVGVVSPLARGAGATMDRLLAGDRAFGKLTLFNAEGVRSQIAAEVPNLTAAEAAPPGEDEGWSRTDAMAVIAAREALAEAGIAPGSQAVDLLVGGTTAGMFETEDLLAELSLDPSALSPMKRMLSHPLSAAADHVHAALGPFRRIRSLCSACSSGSNAILLGAAWLGTGRSRCVLAGGADGLCRLTYTGFGALAALDPNPCRPFDRRRGGLNLGEGAAFLVLERESDARARGAVPLAELRGWAVGAEAHHITNPEAKGVTAARVMVQALARGGLTPADLDYVNAHGTATPLNDAMETAALHSCLGAEVERIGVSSSKGQIGHTLGAAGAIEAAITAMSVARGVMPPTIGLEEVDPACRLVHITEAREGRIRAAMSSSFGFGGTDAVLVFAEPGAFAPLPRPAGRSVVVTGAATIGPLGVRSARAAVAYVEPGASPTEGKIDFEPGLHLDLARARRLDRSGRLVTTAVQTAMAEAGLDPKSDVGAGAIVGSAFGSVDASTAYMRRVYEKGPKYASPADFPNLVPSSPAGHASIYLGLRGPVFSVHDLGATAESAVSTAADLIAAGETSALAAGSVEEASRVVELVVGPICSEILDRSVRSEGASALQLEAAETADVRGAKALAGLVWWTSWRGDGDRELAELPAPPEGAWLLMGRAEAKLFASIDATPWGSVERHMVALRAGDHEGAGGFAMAAAVGAIAEGKTTAVLVVGGGPDRGYALLFRTPAEQGPDGAPKV